jgi:hypothetical protein
VLCKFVGDLVYYVLIEGSNLNSMMKRSVSLFSRGLLHHRITWIQESTAQERSGEGETTIDRIRVHSCRADEEPKGVEWLKPFSERA